MKKLLLLTCFSILVSFAFSQNFTQLYDTPIRVLNKSSDGILVSSGDKVMLLTAQGTPIWSTVYFPGRGMPFAVKADNGDYLLLTSILTSPASNSHTSALIRIDNNGNLLWSKYFDSGSRNLVYGLVKSVNDSYIVGAWTAGDKPWLIRVDGNGGVIWSKKYDYGADDQLAVLSPASDGNGGCVFTGSTIKVSASYVDAFVTEVDVNGNLVNNNIYASEFTSFPHFFPVTLKIDDQGNRYILGWRSETTNDPQNHYLVFLKANGQTGAIEFEKEIVIRQNRSYPVFALMRLARDNAGNSYVTVEIENTGQRIFKFDNAGNIQKTFIGKYNSIASIESLDGELYATGYQFQYSDFPDYENFLSRTDQNLSSCALQEIPSPAFSTSPLTVTPTNPIVSTQSYFDGNYPLSPVLLNINSQLICPLSNNPPVAVDDEAATSEDTPVTIPVTDNDSDPDGNLDPTTVTVTEPPSNGTVTVNPDGSVTCTFGEDYEGTDTFTYEVCDDDGMCDEATVTIEVYPENDQMVAVDDEAVTDEDTPVTITVTDNDSDIDGNVDPTTIVIITAPENCSLEVDPVTGEIVCTPDPGFVGSDVFTYEVCDDGTPLPSTCDEAEVTLTVKSNCTSFDLYVDDFAYGPVGSQVCVPIKTNGFIDGISIQGTINWDSDYLGLSGYGGITNIMLPGMQANAQYFGIGDAANGVLTFVWDDLFNPASIQNGDLVFELCFEVLLNDCTPTEISFSTTPTSLLFVDNTFAECAYTGYAGESITTGGNLSINTTSNKVCPGTPAVLSLPSGFTISQWSTGGAAPSISVASGGNYSVTATDASGCAKTATINIVEPPLKDLYGRDNTSDNGEEPSVGSIYGSPSLKVSYLYQQDFINVPMGAPTYAGITHKNPKYDGPSFPNYVSMQVINRGCEPAGAGALVHFYYKEPSAGASWPSDWVLIGVETIPVDIPAGAEAMVTTNWIPPNPANYPLNLNNGLLHTCMLARIVYPDDPFNFPEGSHTQTNTQNNNEIIWKNVNIMTTEQLVGGMDVENNGTAPVDMRVNFAFVDFDKSFFNDNSVFVRPDQPVLDGLADGSIEATNFINHGDSLEMTAPNAWLDMPNVPAGMSCHVEVRFEVPNGYNAATMDPNYEFNIEQANNGIPEGGVQYVLKMDADDSLPEASVLNGALNGTSQVDLTWENNSTNVFGFILQRSVNDSLNFVSFPMLDENDYSDTGLAPNTTFYYRVKAVNEYGRDADYSNTVSVSTERLSIAGHIRTVDNNDMEGVTLTLSGDLDDTELTPISGLYEFDDNLVLGGTYTATPTKEVAVGENLSNFDALLIKLHVLGNLPLCSPYSIIAADVTGDGGVSNFDALYVKQIVLNNFNAFPIGLSHRFVAEDYVFPDPNDPFTPAFPEKADFPSMMQTRTDVDFIGIEIGDVSGSCPANLRQNLKPAKPMKLQLGEYTAIEGAIIEVPVLASEIEALETFQFTHTWNPEVLEFVAADDFFLGGMSENDFGKAALEKGQLPVFWMAAKQGGETLAANSVLYTLKFKVVGNANMESELAINSALISQEAYNSELQQIEIETTEGKVSILSRENPTATVFTVYPNQPNPFSTTTNIRFYLPESGKVSWSIYNNLGQLVLTNTDYFEKGSQTITWNRRAQPAASSAGVYFLHLKAGENTAIQKMIITD